MANIRSKFCFVSTDTSGAKTGRQKYFEALTDGSIDRMDIIYIEDSKELLYLDSTGVEHVLSATSGKGVKKYDDPFSVNVNELDSGQMIVIKNADGYYDLYVAQPDASSSTGLSLKPFVEGKTDNEIKTLIKSFTGSLESLTTTAKDSLVSAINEINADLVAKGGNVGDLSDLTTTSKSSVVAAVNEIETQIGSLSSLSTTAKSNVVSAVNEVDGKIGSLSSLSTTAKGTIIAAVNEVDAAVDDLKDDIGTLSTLTTTNKSNVVTALNEIDAKILKADWNQNDSTKWDYVKNRTHYTKADGSVERLDTKYIPTDTLVDNSLTVGTRLTGSDTGEKSAAIGYQGKASGLYSTTIGYKNEATANSSIATGYGTKAQGLYSHTEGRQTVASGRSTHAEGEGSTATGEYSHAEGSGTTSEGLYSHAEGYNTSSQGNGSHAEGIGTIAKGVGQHVAGKYNVMDATNIEVIGGGTGESARKNIRTLDPNGKETLADTLVVSRDPTANLEVATKQYVDGKAGTLSNLTTTNKTTLVEAINELKTTDDTNKTDLTVTITEEAGTGDLLKKYTFKQGNTQLGIINLAKDIVVQSGAIVVNPTGQPAGTYLVLTLSDANSSKIYINVQDLATTYTAQANATQVQLAISATNEFSGSIVAGGVGTTELASNAVTTTKITDGSVTSAKIADGTIIASDIADATITKAKLATAVQTSLGKADSAVQAVTTGTSNGSIKVDGTDVSVKGFSDLKDTVDKLDGAVTLAGSVKKQIKDTVNALDTTDTAVSGQYVSKVEQTDGLISVTRADLPVKSVDTTGTDVKLSLNTSKALSVSLTDGSITKSKLVSAVQTSLGKADTAVQSIATGSTNGTISVDGTNVSVKGLGTAAYKNVGDFDADGSADAVLGAAADAATKATVYGVKKYATNLETRIAAIEAGGGAVTVDSALSTTSTNPVQNKVIANKINGLLYAGSSTQGGSATSAEKLDSNAGTATNPVYFSNGVPVKTTYKLEASVPSDAVFTDTTYSTGNGTTAGITKLYTSTGTSVDGSMTRKAITDALGDKIDTNKIGVASGVASLGTDTKVPSTQLPTASSTVLGAIKVGSNLSIASSVLSAKNMTGASASAAGEAGYVPAPAAGANGKFLRGDGTWSEVILYNTTEPSGVPNGTTWISTAT